jgi:large subunit ribosomal protein L29
MKAAEIRRLSPEESVQRVNDLADDLFRLRFQLISGQLQDYRRIREVKRQLAKVKTVIRERELQINQAPAEAIVGEGASAEE